ncbi:MAG: winged helix-turn-helix domain-containing protein [Bifidobacteriaceae bacterium]|jgi:hypothetical protein|nr:winged helix-turn-helix domain-containing protein [Bifidobacteriaceae bacterium]
MTWLEAAELVLKEAGEPLGGTEIAGTAAGTAAGTDPDTEPDALIGAFGVQWRRDRVDWAPTKPKLLGRQLSGSTNVDFSEQRGVYVLHAGARALYAGRATKDALSARLRAHTNDRMSGRWDRFTWFGILGVADDAKLTAPPTGIGADALITALEAVLIESLETPLNRRSGDALNGREFSQVEDPGLAKKQKKALLEELLGAAKP